MPLHHTSLVSRHTLTHPDQPSSKKSLPAFEQVLKFNTHHDAHGRFSSGGSGGKTTLDEAAAKIKAHNDAVGGPPMKSVVHTGDLMEGFPYPKQALKPRSPKEQAELDKAAATIKAHNDQVDRDRAAGTGKHTTDAEYDAYMAEYRKKKKKKA